jgi:hypothetical protein
MSGALLNAVKVAWLASLLLTTLLPFLAVPLRLPLTLRSPNPPLQVLLDAATALWYLHNT